VTLMIPVSNSLHYLHTPWQDKWFWKSKRSELSEASSEQTHNQYNVELSTKQSMEVPKTLFDFLLNVICTYSHFLFMHMLCNISPVSVAAISVSLFQIYHRLCPPTCGGSEFKINSL